MSGRCWSWWPMVLNPPPHCAPIFPKSSPSRLKKRGFSKDLQCSPQYSWQQSPMQCFPMFQQLSWLARSKYQKNNINQSWCCFTICQIPNFVKDASLAKLCIFCSRPCTFARKGQLPNFHTKRGNLISAKETFNTISFEEKPSTLRGNKDVNSIGVYLKFRQDPAHKGELRRVTSFSQRQIFGNHLGIYFTTIWFILYIYTPHNYIQFDLGSTTAECS